MRMKLSKLNLFFHKFKIKWIFICNLLINFKIIIKFLNQNCKLFQIKMKLIKINKNKILNWFGNLLKIFKQILLNISKNLIKINLFKNLKKNMGINHLKLK